MVSCLDYGLSKLKTSVLYVKTVCTTIFMHFFNAKWKGCLAGTNLYFAPIMWPHQRVMASDKNASTSLCLHQLLSRVRVCVLM